MISFDESLLLYCSIVVEERPGSQPKSDQYDQQHQITCTREC